MSESVFKTCIRKYMRKASIDAPVFFDFDPDRILFFAYVPSEEIRFTGRPGTMKLSVKTGNGRTFMVDAAAC